MKTSRNGIQYCIITYNEKLRKNKIQKNSYSIIFIIVLWEKRPLLVN